MKEKWTLKEPKPSSLVICYFRGSTMLYWINAMGNITDSNTGHLHIENTHYLGQIKKGYWEYANLEQTR